MAKRRFNDKWLEKQDPNNQLVSLWCSKKNDYTAACSFCKADISVDHMGFGSLKQQANGSKHKQLAGVSNISQEGKPKHQSSLSSFFIKSDPQPVKSVTPPEKSVGASDLRRKKRTASAWHWNQGHCNPTDITRSQKKGISHTIISIVPPKLFYMCKTYSKIIYLD